MAKYRPKYPELEFEGSTDDELQIQQTRWRPKVQKPTKNQCIPVKYKTELCKNFEEKGWCPYRIKCQYAHGYHELVREPPSKKGYRTRRCYSFWTKGTCTYGKRCQFSHYQVEPATTLYLKIVKEVLDGDNFTPSCRSRLDPLFI